MPQSVLKNVTLSRGTGWQPVLEWFLHGLAARATGLSKRSVVIAVALVVGFLFSTPLAGFAAIESIDAKATELFKSLTDEQRAQALLPFDDKERNSEVFPAGQRPGIQIAALNDDQKKQAIALITSFVSDYGKQKVDAVTQQGENPGYDRYWLCFFGDPTKEKTHAWRVAEHHMTLVQVEVEEGKPLIFGPILQGANPPTLWDDEEDAMIALYGALSESDRKKVARRGRGISAVLFKDGEGALVSELSSPAKEKVQAVFDSRLKFFTPEVQERVRSLVEQQGGLDAMRIAYFGAAEKRCRDGGKWDFKLGGDAFLCDYENSRGHIHMAMKGWLGEAQRSQ